MSMTSRTKRGPFIDVQAASLENEGKHSANLSNGFLNVKGGKYSGAQSVNNFEP